MKKVQKIPVFTELTDIDTRQDMGRNLSKKLKIEDQNDRKVNYLVLDYLYRIRKIVNEKVINELGLLI